MPVVHGQVAAVGRDIIVGRQPLTALLWQQDVQEAILGAVVEHQRGPVASGGKGTLGVRRLPICQHCPEGEGDAPGETAYRHRARNAVPHLTGDSDTLRTACGDDEGYRKRSWWGEAGRVQHLDEFPLPQHLPPAQQPPERMHIRGHVTPPQSALPQRHAAREAGPDPDDHPLWAGKPHESGNGRRVRHRMTQARDEDPGAEADACGALGRTTQLHPYIRIERWRVVEEGAAVSERLRDTRVLMALRGRSERTGKLESHRYTSVLLTYPVLSDPRRWRDYAMIRRLSRRCCF